MGKIKYILLLIVVSVQISNAVLLNDSLSVNDIIKAEIVQSDRKDDIVKLVVMNMATDTIILFSKFVLNNPLRVYPYILINASYEQEDSDSIFWYWDYNELDPIIITYLNGKTIIPPRAASSFEIPVARKHFGKSILFRVRFSITYRDEVYMQMLDTNKVLLRRREIEDNK